jgi:hypothetical protein
VKLNDLPRLHRDSIRVTKKLDVHYVQISINFRFPGASILDRRHCRLVF